MNRQRPSFEAYFRRPNERRTGTDEIVQQLASLADRGTKFVRPVPRLEVL